MPDKYILYSTDCPKCKILKKKMSEKGIQFVENASVDEMLELGLTTVPVLRVGDEFLDFKAALEWVKDK